MCDYRVRANRIGQVGRSHAPNSLLNRKPGTGRNMLWGCNHKSSRLNVFGLLMFAPLGASGVLSNSQNNSMNHL